MKNNIQKILEVSRLGDAISDLTAEAENLIKIVQVYSSKIIEIEIDLENLKAHFPFKKLIKSEKKPSHLTPSEPEHKQQCVGTLIGYYKHSEWSFSWERDENCKNKRFRLFLIEEEREVIVFDHDEKLWQETEIKRTAIFKKAFAEANLKIKLRFSEYFLPFVYDFTDFLK